jgi:hypothetical protein
MSSTLWLQVNDGKSADSPDNSMLLRFESELAALAERLNVSPLTMYYGFSGFEEATAEFADELMDAGIELPGAAEVWWDSAEGYASVSALARELRDHPESLGFHPARGQEHWPAMLAEELSWAEARLRDAAANGQGFRLQVVA